jgi:CheY-like chemotaxis protein
MTERVRDGALEHPTDRARTRAGARTHGELASFWQQPVLLQRRRTVVIILELSMPVMNGLTAASKLRRIFPTTPISLFILYGDLLSETVASESGVSLLLAENRTSFRAKAHQLMGNWGLTVSSG